jgi:hypothetical protein
MSVPWAREISACTALIDVLITMANTLSKVNFAFPCAAHFGDLFQL